MVLGDYDRDGETGAFLELRSMYLIKRDSAECMGLLAQSMEVSSNTDAECKSTSNSYL